MADAPLCPETGLPMVRGTRPKTITYKGQSATFDMPGWYCASGESTHVGDDLRVYARELCELKARVHDLAGPAEVRRIRTALGVSQREAGRLIGGGPNAFQKYESGEVQTSRAVTTSLRLLERHPEELERMRQEHYAEEMVA
jgi:HTH-type transcriptional regulator / antitoxin MqsA